MKRIEGFTLIELVISLLLTTILAGIVGSILNVGFSSYFTGREIIPVAVKVNTALNNLMRELESAESLTSATTTSINFMNEGGESVAISLSGTDLKRSVNGGTAYLLCNNVSALTFSFYDSSLASTATPSSVRLLTAQVSINEGGKVYSIMAAGTVIRKKL